MLMPPLLPTAFHGSAGIEARLAQTQTGVDVLLVRFVRVFGGGVIGGGLMAELARCNIRAQTSLQLPLRIRSPPNHALPLTLRQVSDGSGAGRSGKEQKDVLPPLMPGLKARQQD